MSTPPLPLLINGVPQDCPSRKRAYIDRAQAFDHIGRMARRTDMGIGESDHSPVNAYECPQCGAWHTSSWPAFYFPEVAS